MVTVSAAWTTWPSLEMSPAGARVGGEIFEVIHLLQRSQIRQPWELGPLFEVQSDEVHTVRRAGRDQGVERPTFLFGLGDGPQPCTNGMAAPQVRGSGKSTLPRNHRSTFQSPPSWVPPEPSRSEGLEGIRR